MQLHKNFQKIFLTIIALLLIVVVSGCSKTRQEFPKTDRKPVTDEYYGIKIIDDYRWLDNPNDPVVRTWIAAQNTFSRMYFNKVSSLTAIRERLKILHSIQSVDYSSLIHRKKLFALKFQPPKNQRFIVVLDSPRDPQSERVVVDPNELNPKGTTAIDWFVPSRNGRLIAVSLSDNGSEDGSVHVFDVASGKEIAEVVPRVQYPTGGGSLEWDKNGAGFYYTRYPQGNERPEGDRNFFQQVYYHKLGVPASEDTYIIGKEFPRIAEIKLLSSEDGNYILAQVANGDGGEFAHYLLGSYGNWTQITRFSDKISTVVFGKGMLYLLSRQNAPRGKILALPIIKPHLVEAKTVVPESNVSISDLIIGKGYLYIVDINGGPSQIRMLNHVNKKEDYVPIQPISSVDEFIVIDKDELLFKNETYLSPSSWYKYDPADYTVKRVLLDKTVKEDIGDVEVARELATSKDGTKIPMNIIRRKGTELNGKNPTILYGYGGFGICETPGFSTSRLLWLEQGGVYVIANIRGGEEFGEEWHDQGKLTKKQNVFDDFIACAEFLINKRYTNTSKLAIEGGSNGGLLMGAILTQRPELFRAVVSYVGIYDMLRAELFPNGAFNVTEYGSVKDPEQFKALYAYSPYHHVINDKAYPAVLFMTGDNDGRVDPANSRKMIARLQASTSSNLPLLLRTDSDAGHGIGTGLNTMVAQEADMFAFLFDQLGIEYKAITKK